MSASFHWRRPPTGKSQRLSSASLLDKSSVLLNRALTKKVVPVIRLRIRSGFRTPRRSSAISNTATCLHRKVLGLPSESFICPPRGNEPRRTPICMYARNAHTGGWQYRPEPPRAAPVSWRQHGPCSGMVCCRDRTGSPPRPLLVIDGKCNAQSIPVPTNTGSEASAATPRNAHKAPQLLSFNRN